MNAYHLNSLQKGHTESFTYTVTEESMSLFCKLSGDISPIHMSDAAAQARGHSGRVVYGMLGASLFSTLAGVYLPGETCLLHSVEAKFAKPVYIGDTLTVTGTVQEVNETFAEITIKASITNQNGEKVTRGIIKAGVTRPKIYLETTMFNFYFHPEREAYAATVQLFEDIRAGKYEAYTSQYVIDELEEAQEPKRSKMLSLIIEYAIKVIPASEEARQMASTYVLEGIVTPNSFLDALHIATASVSNLEYILSLNFRHINRLKTKEMTAIVNVKKGYKPITIASTMEVSDYGENEY